MVAALAPEHRRRILAIGAGTLLAAVLVAVVAAPEQGLVLTAAALGALFLVAQPHWGILAIFVLVIFRINPVGIGPLGTSELLAVPLLLPLALRILRDRGIWVSRVPQMRILLAIGVVLLVAAEWSLVMHPAPPPSMDDGPWSPLILFGQQLLFLTFLVYFIRTPRQLAHAVVILLLMILAGVVDSLSPLASAGLTDRARVSQGWAANSNRLAFLCVWGTALAWSLRFKGPAGWWRPLTLVPLLGLPIATLMTGSRNGLLQLMLLSALIVLEQRQWSPARRVRASALMVVAGLLVLALAPDAMMERASNFQESSVLDRIATHWAAAAMVVEYPLFGVGPGNFRWRNYLLTGHGMSTHDSYLWALTAGGPLLLVLYLALFHRTYRHLLAVEQHGPRELLWVATALRMNLFVLMGFSFFADLWLSHPFYLLLGLTIALVRIARTLPVPIASVPQPARLATVPAWGR
jgi:hypothetical protein